MIRYEFMLDDGTTRAFDVDPRRGAPEGGPLPTWTALDYHQCAGCPLSGDAHPTCPPAVDLVRVMEAFGDVVSHQATEVRVITQERTYLKACDVQTGLGSLFGLIMATSACPILGRMRGMARFHLPFSSMEETVFRTTSSFLIRRYFAARRGRAVDFDLAELRAFYATLQKVNTDFSNRIRYAVQEDASANAVSILFCLSALVSFSLEDELDQLAQDFE
jgi:hypothetical protein